MPIKPKPFDHDHSPTEVHYYFNKAGFRCSFEVGEDCLTAALKDILNWTVTEYVRATRLSSLDSTGRGTTYQLDLFYPCRDTPEPDHTVVLSILNSPDNVAIDTSSEWYRTLSGLEPLYLKATSRTLKHTKSLF